MSIARLTCLACAVTLGAWLGALVRISLNAAAGHGTAYSATLLLVAQFLGTMVFAMWSKRRTSGDVESSGSLDGNQCNDGPANVAPSLSSNNLGNAVSPDASTTTKKAWSDSEIITLAVQGGLCGSMTSFSGWMTETATATAKIGALSLPLELFLGLCVTLAAWTTGSTPALRIPIEKVRGRVAVLCVGIAGVLVLLGLLGLGLGLGKLDSVVGVLVAPVGATCRIILGRILNPLGLSWRPPFPLGTLVANMAATIIASLAASNHVALTPIVRGLLGSGIAGSLSTLSTLATEVLAGAGRGMSVAHRTVYALVTGILGLAISLSALLSSP